jgi:acetylornithine deacetylase/succinyl-diaminopimelate desuccinylase-like protein
MEAVLQQTASRSVVIPYMQRGGTDGSFLRQRGVAVYGVPLFMREDRENRAHGIDERISVANLEVGTNLLWTIVTRVAGR